MGRLIFEIALVTLTLAQAGTRESDRKTLIEFERQIDLAKQTPNRRFLKTVLSPTYHLMDKYVGRTDFWKTFQPTRDHTIGHRYSQKVISVNADGKQAVVRVARWERYSVKRISRIATYTGASLADDHWSKQDGKWILQWTKVIHPLVMQEVRPRKR